MPGERLSREEANALCTQVLSAAGARGEHAAMTARIMVESEMMGLATHGLVRVPGYAERLRSGGIDAAGVPRIEPRAPSLALVDGANALGPVVASCALDAAIDMARATGIAYAGCRRSNHLGALAPYALRACEAGFVVLAGTNASTSMPPWGGAALRMGNNPLGIAAPAADGEHFILDMAMSVAARGKIRAARNAGQPIPAGWATDARGVPTTDPALALEGFLLAMGGHKGSGLSMAIDLLSGVLSGARFLTDVSSWIHAPHEPQGLGHFFLLVDPARLLGPEGWDAAFARFRHLLRETPAALTGVPVHLPGDGLLARRARALSEGIEVPSDVVSTLRALATP